MDEVVRGSIDTLNITFSSAGNRTVQFTYLDFLDHNYSSTFTVRMLDAASFNGEMAAVQEAQLLLLMADVPSNFIYLPSVMH